VNIKKSGSDAYKENRKTYIEKRNAIIEMIKNVDEDTVKRFERGTNKWLKSINNIYKNIKLESKETIDKLLADFLKFATSDNMYSLNQIQSSLQEGVSEQKIKHSLNLHVEEIDKFLSNSEEHIKPHLKKKEHSR
jgi:hypothetical protein